VSASTEARVELQLVRIDSSLVDEMQIFGEVRAGADVVTLVLQRQDGDGNLNEGVEVIVGLGRNDSGTLAARNALACSQAIPVLEAALAALRARAL
jgi:hypothetical protein